jgi:glycine C-acetyltransferase
MFSKELKNNFQRELDEIRKNGTYKEEAPISGRQGAEIEVGGKDLLNFCSNNYLGLAGSDMLKDVAKKALDESGFGMSSVRFICGTGTIHKQLELEAAKFFQMEDAILYSSCFDANTGLFETVLTAEDAVFSDELNHASIIDGIRLSKAERNIYKHSDMDDLEAKLEEMADKRRKLIVTDGVFSMDGDTAKLKEICDLADKHGALVMVDDSHASGVLGETGRGSIESGGVMGRVDILTSTFGKALGGASGGFTTGRGEIIEYLRQRSRPYLFSNTLVPAVAATALFVLRNFDTKLKNVRADLQKNTKYFREQMDDLGFKLGGDGRHPITPVMLMDENITVKMADKLLHEKGIYVRGFTYPVVPQGKARIRVQLSAEHTTDQIDKAVRAFAEVGKELRII